MKFKSKTTTSWLQRLGAATGILKFKTIQYGYFFKSLIFGDSTTVTDTVSITPTKSSAENIYIIDDILTNNIGSVKSDLTNISDITSINVNTGFSEDTAITDSGAYNIQDYITNTYFASDYVGVNGSIS